MLSGNDDDGTAKKNTHSIFNYLRIARPFKSKNI
jgi:hypothetical protein